MAAKSVEEYPYKVTGYFQHGSPFKFKGKPGSYDLIIHKSRGIEGAERELNNFKALGGLKCSIIDRKTKTEINL